MDPCLKPVWDCIFSHCDLRSYGRLAQTCQALHKVANLPRHVVRQVRGLKESIQDAQPLTLEDFLNNSSYHSTDFLRVRNPSLETVLEALHNPWILELLNDQMQCRLGEKSLTGVLHKNPFMLRHVCDQMRTRAVCMAAVTISGDVIQYLSDAQQKKVGMEVCIAAVNSRSYALQYVCEAMRTPELVVQTFMKDGMSLAYLSHSEQRNLGVTVCIQAVEKNGLAIKYLCDDLKTKEVCLAAIKEDPYALRYISTAKQLELGKELCLEAIRRDKTVFPHVCDQMKAIHPELYLEVIRQDRKYALHFY